MPARDENEPVNGDGGAPPVPPRATLQRDARALVPVRKVKCVLVGDGAVGKTSLVVSYTTNGYPAKHIPTAFDHFTGKTHDEFDRLRPLCYHDADVFLLCYSVVLPVSFKNITDCWAPEVRRLCPGVPMILVGTQCDLREDVQVLITLADEQEKPISTDEGLLCARSIGAVAFAECSALTQKNLKEVFDCAIVANMRHAEEGGWLRRDTLRDKTPDKIKQLSETWWRKLSCLM
ncbi:Rho-related GTP-binding protein [Triplophysa tibetana]|uniref:Rho-related GTP-binding protein n=1 Tax=Triplophysa tibetana TaxID=1572043 RepID=A0A5A9PLR0_9TELE|nr:Rho-related GTP-binding protein [Triplophysa tibetana]